MLLEGFWEWERVRGEKHRNVGGGGEHVGGGAFDISFGKWWEGAVDES